MLAFALAACGGGDSATNDAVSVEPPAPPLLGGTPARPFSNPERVTILNYNDDVMEPFISPDGRYLFFNNAGANLDLRYAERIDDTTFDYKGQVGGVNASFLDAVPSIDRNNVFHFVSLRNYQQTLSSLFRGNFADGSVTGIEQVAGISTAALGFIDYDSAINYDGDTLYYSTGLFVGLNVPIAASISIATRGSAGFVRAANSDDIMRQVNAGGIAYAASISKSGLELFFNRVEVITPAIYTATRTSTGLPFTAVQKVTAIQGFGEGAALSADEKSLYYQGVLGGRFVLYRVSRP